VKFFLTFKSKYIIPSKRKAEVGTDAPVFDGRVDLQNETGNIFTSHEFFIDMELKLFNDRRRQPAVHRLPVEHG